MRRSRKVLALLLIIGFVGFGYSQYLSASQIGVTITQSELFGDEGSDSMYNMQLQFDNPSLLYLTSGKTEFVVSADEKRVGEGTLSPFVLPALTTATAYGTFEADKQFERSEHMPVVKISGITQYDVIVTSIDIPFVFYPTQEQAREFIHQG